MIFFITPMPDDTFLQTLVMWEYHERNSSSSTPRHLLQLTFYFNDMPFIERSRLSVTVAILCLEPINMYSVFNMFRVSLLAQSHCLSFSMSAFISCRNPSTLQAVKVMLVSSAYILVVAKSVINVKKILAVINATYAVAKRNPEKIRLAGIRTLTSAIPVQRSNQLS